MPRMRTANPEYWDEYSFTLPRLVYSGSMLTPDELYDMMTASWQISYVYHVFNMRGDLLYVGYTTQPFHRWSAHRRSAKWWRHAVTMNFYEVWGKNRNTANFGGRYWERHAIAGGSPLYNLQGPASLPAKNRKRKAS